MYEVPPPAAADAMAEFEVGGIIADEDDALCNSAMADNDCKSDNDDADEDEDVEAVDEEDNDVSDGRECDRENTCNKNEN